MSKVSIIVPCYKLGKYLPEALDSVLAQDYTDWECIIVNDGSPDSTAEVAESFCTKDSRFKSLDLENGGVIRARNKGVAASSGKYLLFLDADDMLKVVSIADRKEAIRTACMIAQKGDVILVAGKGHEDYQEIKGKKYPMDERVLVAQILDEESAKGTV